MGAHAALYGGAPLEVAPPKLDPRAPGFPGLGVDFVGFYRWHLPDPIMFGNDLRVTIQQIGGAGFTSPEEFGAFKAHRRVAAPGWIEPDPTPGGVVAHGIYERSDDYCATAFVYCTTPQAVAPVDVTAATADIARRPYEQPGPVEAFMREPSTW